VCLHLSIIYINSLSKYFGPKADITSASAYAAPVLIVREQSEFSISFSQSMIDEEYSNPMPSHSLPKALLAYALT